MFYSYLILSIMPLVVKKTKSEADLDKHIRMKTVTFVSQSKIQANEKGRFSTVGHSDGIQLW